jgi:saposin
MIIFALFAGLFVFASSNEVVEVKEWPAIKVKANTCTSCTQIVNVVHGFLANKTDQQIADTIKEVCSLLPTELEKKCVQYASILVPLINQYLADPKALCTQIGMCGGNVNSKNVMKQMIIAILEDSYKKENADYCLTCQQYAGTLHLLISNPSSKQELVSGLEEICTVLPKSISSECTTAMEIFAPQIVDALVNYLAKPIKFCTLIGLCKSQATPSMYVQKKSLYGVVKVEKIMKAPIKRTIKTLNSDETCLLCTYAVGVADVYLKQYGTLENIEGALNQVCGIIGDADLKAECATLVSQYAPLLLNLALSQLNNPQAVCKELSICPAKIQVSAAKVKANVVECEACTYVMGYLDSMITKSSTEDEIKQALDSLCSRLPASVSGQCDALVSQYTDQIIRLLVNQLANPSTVCKELGLCASQKKVSMSKVESNPVTCKACSYVMGYLDGLLEKDSTKAEIKGALDKVCGYLPSSAKGECITLVNTYSDEIIDLIVAVGNPSTVCKTIQLCSSPAKVSAAKVKANVVECEACTYVMGYLDSMITKSSTEDEIKQALDSLCSRLPASVSGECDALVSQYTDEIIKLLVSQLANPSTVCKELGLCASQKKAPVKKVENAVTCELCTVAMGYLDNLLEGNKSEAAVTQALDSLCAQLPSSYSSECTALVDQYTPQILQLIVNELADPTTICKEIQLCASSKRITTRVASPKKLKGSAVSCKLCEYVMGVLDKALGSKTTEAKIIDVVDNLCDHVPKYYAEECKSLIDNYGDAVIELLIKEVQPNAVCHLISLCTSSKQEIVVASTLTKQEIVVASKMSSLVVKGKDVPCEFCMYAMGALDQVIGQKTTEDKIIHAVESLCDHLPKTYSSECKSLVDNYGDAIIQALIKEVQPDVVCQFVKLCQSKNHVQRKFMLAMRMRKVKSTSCEVCQYALGYLDQQIETKGAETKIEEEVESLCSHLPATFMNECDALITEYGPDLIKLVVDNFLSPKKVCKEISLC